ncbi:MAG: hypothetical protein Q8M51_13140 [Polaromonas sp.]|nr:hypothetical protein [Polaromonas sp.]
MQLHKSDKARLELSSKARVLNLRERSALFLVDGRKTRREVQGLLQDDAGILDKLISTGYLIVVPGATPSPVGVKAKTPLAPEPVPAPARSIELPAAEAPVTSAQGADNFEGKRSLATTRMFLFDICERMFVRKMPELAKQFRDQLREARDRASMMVIARDIIVHVEEIAGAERADGLSERIAMLLPSEQ